MKILILSLTYFDNSIYSKFYNTQLNSWDSVDVEDITTMYYVGNSDEDKIEDKVVYTTVKESILNAGYKTLRAFELTNHINYDVIYRTNSSSYVDKKLLVDFIKNKDFTSIYSGVLGHHAGVDFASGSGYFISKDLVNYVIENKDLWDHQSIDDVALAKILKRKGVPITPAPRYDINKFSQNIPMDYFHYRIKNKDRNSDCDIMQKLHELKNEFHNR